MLFTAGCTVMLAIDQSATVTDTLPGAVSKLAALDQDMVADDPVCPGPS